MILFWQLILLLTIFLILNNHVESFPILHININLHYLNKFNISIYFQYCNTTNIITNEISSELIKFQKFEITSISKKAYGHCTYLYNNTIPINFQWYVNDKNYQYYYGITASNEYFNTHLKIMDKYNTFYIIS